MTHTVARGRDPASQGTAVRHQSATEYIYLALPAIALAVDLLTPQLVTWRILPSQIRWLSDAAVAGMLVISLLMMLLLDRIPRPFFLVLAISVLGVTVALFEGQSVAATAYGWWRMFMYPMVGFYAYLLPKWPAGFALWLMRGALVVLSLQVAIQIGQYLTGTPPGDHLAGTFGSHGVSSLIIYVILVICFGLGIWIYNGDGRYFVVALALGAIASVLGEMKVFPAATIALVLFALLIRNIHGGNIRSSILLLILVTFAIGGFALAVNEIVFASRSGSRAIQDFVDPQVLQDYLLGNPVSTDATYNTARNADVVAAWNQIQFDGASVLLGMGIGSRATSRALGVQGEGFNDLYANTWAGRSLSLFMREVGIVGLLTFLAFALVTSIALYRRAWRADDESVASLLLALALFTLLWPLWFWYSPVWRQAAPMLIYWIALGYALNASTQATTES